MYRRNGVPWNTIRIAVYEVYGWTNRVAQLDYHTWSICYLASIIFASAMDLDPSNRYKLHMEDCIQDFRPWAPLDSYHTLVCAKRQLGCDKLYDPIRLSILPSALVENLKSVPSAPIITDRLWRTSHSGGSLCCGLNRRVLTFWIFAASQPSLPTPIHLGCQGS